MPKRVIISQDYDGCFDLCTETGRDELLARRSAYFKRHVDAKTRALSTRDYYCKYLETLTRGASGVSVYVGSDRQSYSTDTYNAKKNKNGSVFPALKTLCQEMSSQDQKWTFEPVLMADIFLGRGSAMHRIEQHSSEQLLEPPKDMTHSFIRKSGSGVSEERASKLHILYRQMWDAYEQYGTDEELEFYFIDDSIDILNNVMECIDTRKIPPGMTVNIIQYSGTKYICQETPPCELMSLRSYYYSAIEKRQHLEAMQPQRDQVLTPFKQYLEVKKGRCCLNFFSIRNAKLSLVHKLIDKVEADGVSLLQIKRILESFQVENERLKKRAIFRGDDGFGKALQSAIDIIKALALEDGYVSEISSATVSDLTS